MHNPRPLPISNISLIVTAFTTLWLGFVLDDPRYFAFGESGPWNTFKACLTYMNMRNTSRSSRWWYRGGEGSKSKLSSPVERTKFRHYVSIQSRIRWYVFEQQLWHIFLLCLSSSALQGRQQGRAATPYLVFDDPGYSKNQQFSPDQSTFPVGMINLLLIYCSKSGCAPDKYNVASNGRWLRVGDTRMWRSTGRKIHICNGVRMVAGKWRWNFTSQDAKRYADSPNRGVQFCLA